MASVCKHRFVSRTGLKSKEGERIFQCKKCNCYVVEKPGEGKFFCAWGIYWLVMFLLRRTSLYGALITSTSKIIYWITDIAADLVIPLAVSGTFYYLLCPFAIYNPEDEE